MRVGFFTRAYVANPSPGVECAMEGVRACGDEVIVTDNIEEHCDVAFHTSGYASNPRKGSLDVARKRLEERFGSRRLVLESPAFRENLNMEKYPYWRLSLGGFLLDEADYANENSPPDRWMRISREQKIKIEPWRWRPNGKIVICLQKPSDASLRGLDTVAWGKEVAREAREYFPHNEVVLRYHPLHTGRNNPPLREELEDALACVTYTSLSAIESVCMGVPTLTLHPGNLAWPVTIHGFRQLEEAVGAHIWNRFERFQWLCDLGYTQWKEKEIRKGIPWKRLRSRLLGGS